LCAHDRALADFSEAIRLDPADADSYNNRGLTYAAKGDRDRAIADYSTAIRLAPDDPAAFLNRGLIYAARDDLGRAIADQPLPDRHQRSAPDLTGPYRGGAIDEIRLQRAEQQPSRIIGAWPRFVLGSAGDLSQLLQHEVSDGSVLAAFDGALELPHQQRL